MAWYDNIGLDDIVTLLGAYGGYKGWFDSDQEKAGYQGTIPDYTAVREPILQNYSGDRMPGQGGQRYFTDTIYADTPEDMKGQPTYAEAQAITGEQRGELQFLNSILTSENQPLYDLLSQSPTPTPPPEQVPQAPLSENLPPQVTQPPVVEIPYQPPVDRSVRQRDMLRRGYAAGGIVDAMRSLREGGGPQRQQRQMPQRPAMPAPPAQRPMPQQAQGVPQRGIAGQFQRGPGDGMSDSIPAMIDGQQPAEMSSNEFVIPADVVSHVGNGSSEAGAQQFYDMLDRVRKARTGTTQQGRQINPNNFMPA